MSFRKVSKIVQAVQQKEGAGFIVNRPIGSRKLDHYDPFLLLDEMGPVTHKPGEAKGAPWHPHRGFQTVSYILKGELQHQDSLGNKGSLRAGDVQWMTAGSGIVHDEEPSDEFKKKGGTMHGFQLWVNLPSKLKMCDPDYQDVSHDKIPQVQLEKGKAKVIAGEAFGVKAVINTIQPTQYIDFTLEPGADIIHTLPKSFNAFAYVYEGSAFFSDLNQEIERGWMVTLDHGAESVKVRSSKGAKFLFIAGEPTNEPVARYGPFVMNTMEEIHQAFEDYQNGKLMKAAPKFSSKAEHSTPYEPDN